MSFLALLTERATILRPATGPTNSWGEVTAAPAVMVTDAPCAVAEQGVEVTRATGVVATAELAIDLPIDTDVAVDDLLEIDGRRHEVLSVSPVGRRHHLVVRARGVR